MRLNIPLIRQPEGSVDCGIAGIAMLFGFYGIKKSFQIIKKEIEVDKKGTYSPQLGAYLLKHGFDVEIVTMHPKLFTLKDRGSLQVKILGVLKKAYANSKSAQDKKVIAYFKEFIKKGGKICVKIPSIEDIRKEINSGRPLGTLLTSNFLANNIPIFNFHFNIITGYDAKHIYVNDPSSTRLGGAKKYIISDFFFGLFASAHGDVDNAVLIKVRKK